MQWSRLLSKKRLGLEASISERVGGRSPFESDVDRIIFSGAFRRLARKTQVHPLAANDHVHNRLTHSLEVGRVGFALGRGVGLRISKELPEGFDPHDIGTIVHAACLAHDLGNPPFGHAGEEAIGHWFEVDGPKIFGAEILKSEYKKDLMSFEGNAQGFRVLTQTENYLFEGGLRLTSATLGAFMKYPWTSAHPDENKKFGAYLAEASILSDLSSELGLVEKGERRWCRHPLAHLVEAADDICYAIIDLEDAVELKLLKFEEVEVLLLSLFTEKEKSDIKNSYAEKTAYRVNLARLRGPVFDRLVSAAIEAFMKKYDVIMQGDLDKDIFNALDLNDARRLLIPAAKDLARQAAFQDPKKLETELGSYATFECLLQTFCQAAVDAAGQLQNTDGKSALSWKSARVLQMLGDHAPSKDNAPKNSSWSEYQCLRRVVDFVGGMTDNYATYIAKQLQGMAFTGIERP